MPERHTEVKTYRTAYLCDYPDCGGEMVFNGIVLTSHPPQYPHTCSNCGEKAILGKLYPTITHGTEGD